MVVNERALTGRESAEFDACTRQGLVLLGLDGQPHRPDTVVQAIDDRVRALQRRRGGWLRRLLGPRPGSVPLALALGSTWGDQFVTRFGWSRVCLQHAVGELYAVAPPDRSLALFPTYFVKRCLDDPAWECTVALTYNMLASGAIPAQPPGGYLDFVRGVHHIVPPN